MRVSECVCVNVCERLCVCVFQYVYMPVCECLFVCVCVCMYLSIYLFVCLFQCVCVRV